MSLKNWDKECFRPGYSCINQLLPNTHEIYQSFDDNLEVRAVFLNISTAFVNPIQDGPLQGFSQMGRKKAPLFKICYSYPTVKHSYTLPNKDPKII